MLGKFHSGKFMTYSFPSIPSDFTILYVKLLNNDIFYVLFALNSYWVVTSFLLLLKLCFCADTLPDQVFSFLPINIYLLPAGSRPTHNLQQRRMPSLTLQIIFCIVLLPCKRKRKSLKLNCFSINFQPSFWLLVWILHGTLYWSLCLLTDYWLSYISHFN